MSQVGRAYDLTGSAWAAGPARVYDRLAEVVVRHSPVALAARTVLDVGAGTGAASRAIAAAGGTPIAVDLSVGMLRAARASRPASGPTRAAVANAVELPFAAATVDGVVAGFSFNHLAEPAQGFRAALRVCRPGSPIVASAYAADDDHPAKAAVERAARAAGWSAEPWYDALQSGPVRALGTGAGMVAAARGGGVTGEAQTVTVDLPELTTAELVAWRLGMAQFAPFMAGLDAAARARVIATAERDLAGAPPLRRSIIVFAGRA